jgi:hypothetical protein
LLIEGSTQLFLIREFVVDIVPPFLEIDFRDGGNSEHFLVDGWAVQGKDHRWTEGTQSSLCFNSPPADRDYLLELLLSPLTLTGRHPEQRLHVAINETEIGRCGVTHQSFFKFTLPRSLLAEERTMIRFLHPDAISPVMLGISADPRQLGLAFKKIKIRAEAGE